jgi:SAM-dependent methyltransferase
MRPGTTVSNDIPMCTGSGHYPAPIVDLAAQRRDWEDLSRLDPLWAVLSDPSKRYGGWDKEEFFALGERDVTHFLDVCARHELPRGRASALDFGCGAGRLSRALSSRFDRCVGVDISERMVEVARDLNQDRPGCEFHVNDSTDLSRFDDATFDFVVSHLVLQHIPGQDAILRYVGEFARVLRPGGAIVFQLPGSLPVLWRLQLMRRLYLGLRRVGFSADTLYRRGLQPMHMSAVAREVVTNCLGEHGARPFEVVTERQSGGMVSVGYYATR